MRMCEEGMESSRFESILMRRMPCADVRGGPWDPVVPSLYVDVRGGHGIQSFRVYIDEEDAFCGCARGVMGSNRSESICGCVKGPWNSVVPSLVPVISNRGMWHSPKQNSHKLASTGFLAS